MRFLLLTLIAVVICLGVGCTTVQRKLLYHPTHDSQATRLEEWSHNGQLIGFCRPVTTSHNVWLLVHGNGGQAADRNYALPCFSPEDSVYILEYPGYGQRAGIPSLQSINVATREAYNLLRAQFPDKPVCVVGESIGTGTACTLATHPRPPDKLVLIVPFAVLKDVADDHFPLLPTGLMLRDNWNNIEALKDYAGPLEIFAATGDTIIPIRHAKALAATKPQTVFHEFAGGHNDWPNSGSVSIRNP